MMFLNSERERGAGRPGPSAVCLASLSILAALSFGCAVPSAPSSASPSPATAPVATPAASPAAGPEASPSPAAASATPAPIAVQEIAKRFTDLSETVRQIGPHLDQARAVEAIDQQTMAMGATLNAQSAQDLALLDQGPTLDELRELEKEWRDRNAQLAAWAREIRPQATTLEADLQLMKDQQAQWERTLSLLRDDPSVREDLGQDAYLSSLNLTQQAAGMASSTRSQIENRIQSMVAVQNRISELSQIVTATLDRITGEEALFQGRLLRRESRVLWRSWRATGNARAILAELRQSFSKNLGLLSDHFRLTRGAIAIALISFLLTLLVTRALGYRLQIWGEENAEIRAAAEILNRPLAVALFVALLAYSWLVVREPLVVTGLIGSLLLIPILRLLPPLLIYPRLRPLLFAFGIFYLLDHVRRLASGGESFDRLLLLLVVAGLFGSGVWLLRAARLKKIEEARKLPKLLFYALRVALGLLAVSVGANILGYVTLARLLGEGTVNSIFLAIFLYSGVRIAALLTSLLLHTTRANRLASVRAHGEEINRWAIRIFSLIAGLIWLIRVVYYFHLEDQVFPAIRRMLQASLRLGSLSISLGDVLAFTLTLAVFYAVATVARVVLHEDVMPRLSNRRGIPTTVSTTIYYLCLFFGFMIALGAAGIDLTSITILTGALGVGIGFGLQNIFNNFVSGLILLFERPIKVGDTIEVAGVTGDVRQIGIRSSTVRTQQGADVIVPNSSFVSGTVINWTLTDDLHRIDIPVGAAYGTDPGRVMEILTGLGQAHPSVLPEPEPSTAFLGFGDNALNFELRCWTLQSKVIAVRNELAVGIIAALREAGIEIPFPQRDLHLRSLDGPVRDLLDARAGEKSDSDNAPATGETAAKGD
jgi:small-conductance mechanosensitive channel